jgi:hypothetical protein
MYKVLRQILLKNATRTQRGATFFSKVMRVSPVNKDYNKILFINRIKKNFSNEIEEKASNHSEEGSSAAHIQVYYFILLTIILREEAILTSEQI